MIGDGDNGGVAGRCDEGCGVSIGHARGGDIDLGFGGLGGSFGS